VFGIKRKPVGPRNSTEAPLEAFLASLPRDDPLVALPGLAAQLDSLATAPIQPARLYELVDLIDRTGRPHYRRLAHGFISEHRQLTKFQEERLWNTVAGYLSQLVQGYRLCLAKCEVGASGSTLLMSLLPVITVRALRASAARLKWSYLRYRSVDAQHWKELNGLYVLAEQLGFAGKRVSPYRGAKHECSGEQEFLQALMLDAASPRSLLPEQIEVAERLVTHCAQAFALSEKAGPGLTHYIDLVADAGPHRLAGMRGLPHTVRVFGAGKAIEKLQAIGERLDEGSISPSEFGLGPGFEGEIVRATVRHLLRYWGPPVPERRHSRERHVTRITVLHGFDEVASNVGGMHYPFVSEQEEWVVENRSRSGLHAMARSPHGRWVSVGSLVALREADHALWTLGLVRRIERDDDDTRHVALETLARGGAAVTILPHTSAKPKHDAEGTMCLLLPGPNGVGQLIRLLLPPDTFSASAPLEMRAYDHRYLLIPAELLESSSDCQVGQYKILRPAN
jgi:hypothetical protein